MIALWLTGLLSRRSGRLLGAVAGVALTVALLAALGSFIAASAGSMTQRAIAAVPVDWQLLLAPGADPLNLRLQSAHDNQYHVVSFHFVGVVREFPTAPKDLFLVANASYIAQQTGTDAAEIVLLRTIGNAAAVAQAAQAVVARLAGARVTDISATQRVMSSSLTAVDWILRRGWRTSPVWKQSATCFWNTIPC